MAEILEVKRVILVITTTPVVEKEFFISDTELKLFKIERERTGGGRKERKREMI